MGLRLLLPGLLLLGQGLGFRLLTLHLVNSLNKHALVLVGVTLGLAVEEVILSFTHSAELDAVI